MNPFRFSTKVLFSLALLVGIVGCATNDWKREDQLTAAGFRIFVAGKPSELVLLKGLPPNKISPVVIKKRTYYVFPDPKNNRIYAGTPKEFDVYQHRREKRKLAKEAIETKKLNDYTDFGAWGAVNYGWYSF